MHVPITYHDDFVQRIDINFGGCDVRPSAAACSPGERVLLPVTVTQASRPGEVTFASSAILVPLSPPGPPQHAHVPAEARRGRTR